MPYGARAASHFFANDADGGGDDGTTPNSSHSSDASPNNWSVAANDVAHSNHMCEMRAAHNVITADHD